MSRRRRIGEGMRRRRLEIVCAGCGTRLATWEVTTPSMTIEGWAEPAGQGEGDEANGRWRFTCPNRECQARPVVTTARMMAKVAEVREAPTDDVVRFAV